MKKFFLFLLGTMVLCACSKTQTEQEIDLSKISFEAELSCVSDYVSSGTKHHTILCTGKLGGFNGDVVVCISPAFSSSIYGSGSKNLTVAGEYTSFSFSFDVGEDNDYVENTPQTCDISVTKGTTGYGPTLFKSSVVVNL